MNLPSVTTIISPYIDFSMVPEATLAQATERGTQVHKLCSAYAQNIYTPVASEYAGYFTSFKVWFDEYVEEVIYVEKELIDKTYGFMGHLDFYGRLKSLGMALIDLKTPIALYKAWKVQLSAYHRLLLVDKRKVDVVASLQLDAYGKIPRMVRYENTNAEDFNVFLGLLNSWNYFK